MTQIAASNPTGLFPQKHPPYPSPPDAEKIRRYFLNHYASGREDDFFPEIIDISLLIPCELPHFHKRLLEAYASAQNRGTREQAHTAYAIQELFKRNALFSSTGSFDNSVLQFLITEVIAQGGDLAPIFKGMESGLSRTKINQIVEELDQDLKYPLRDRFQCTAKQIRLVEHAARHAPYPQEEIAAAIDFARKHPLGALVLRRIIFILLVQDIPEKLREFHFEENDPLDTLEYLKTLLREKGMSREQIIEEIRGSRHTGYLPHRTVAEDIVETFLEDILPLVENSVERSTGRWRKIHQALNLIFEKKSEFTTEDLLGLLQVNSEPKILSYLKQFEIDIEVVSHREFCRHYSNLKSNSSGSCLFEKRRPAKRDRILICGLKDSERDFPKAACKDRLSGIPHELKHLLQSFDQFDFRRLNRRDRLASEVPAWLWGHAWFIRNGMNEFAARASRLGEPLALYYRNIADENYHRILNERLLRKKI